MQIKYTIYVVYVIILSFLVYGCSATPLTSNQINLQKSAYDSKTACYDMLKSRENVINTYISQVPKDQIALVLVLTQMQENNKQLMAIATGNSADPCDIGTTAFDVQIAEVEAKNKVVGNIGGNITNLGKFIAGSIAVINVSDDLSKAKGSTTIGDGNTIDSYKSTNGSTTSSDNVLSGDNANMPSNGTNTETNNNDNSVSTPTDTNN